MMFVSLTSGTMDVIYGPGPPTKSLEIPKGLSESVNRGRTDNIMAKRKRTKGQTTIYKALHIKLTIE